MSLAGIKCVLNHVFKTLMGGNGLVRCLLCCWSLAPWWWMAVIFALNCKRFTTSSIYQTGTIAELDLGWFANGENHECGEDVGGCDCQDGTIVIADDIEIVGRRKRSACGKQQ